MLLADIHVIKLYGNTEKNLANNSYLDIRFNLCNISNELFLSTVLTLYYADESRGY